MFLMIFYSIISQSSDKQRKNSKNFGFLIEFYLKNVNDSIKRMWLDTTINTIKKQLQGLTT